jgi:hypothetical protein
VLKPYHPHLDLSMGKWSGKGKSNWLLYSRDNWQVSLVHRTSNTQQVRSSKDASLTLYGQRNNRLGNSRWLYLDIWFIKVMNIITIGDLKSTTQNGSFPYSFLKMMYYPFMLVNSLSYPIHFFLDLIYGPKHIIFKFY